MEKLIATYPILYLSKQYEVGDELPANNPQMVDAWLNAKTAVWKEKSSNAEDFSSAIATPISVEAGLEGSAVNAETSDNLVGKVPKTFARNRK